MLFLKKKRKKKNRQKKMQVHKALTNISNLFLAAMQKSFPDSYVNFPPYTEEDCFLRLNRDVTKEFLEACFKRKKQIMFAKTADDMNGLMTLFGLEQDIDTFSTEELAKWWTSVHEIVKFISIIRATGSSLPNMEKVALLAKQKATTPIKPGESALKRGFEMMMDPDIREIMKLNFSDIDGIKEMFKNLGPLIQCIAPPVEFPEEEEVEKKESCDESGGSAEASGPKETNDATGAIPPGLLEMASRMAIQAQGANSKPSNVFKQFRDAKNASSGGKGKKSAADKMTELLSDLNPSDEEFTKIMSGVKDVLDGKSESPELQFAADAFKNGSFEKISNLTKGESVEPVTEQVEPIEPVESVTELSEPCQVVE